ncbi:MAG: hypothetical protein AAF677_00775 [Pseudomonadota bacterium]
MAELKHDTAEPAPVATAAASNARVMPDPAERPAPPSRVWNGVLGFGVLSVALTLVVASDTWAAALALGVGVVALALLGVALGIVLDAALDILIPVFGVGLIAVAGLALLGGLYPVLGLGALVIAVATVVILWNLLF